MVDFPSYTFTGIRPTREIELAPDWGAITDTYEFEDGSKDFNEVADTAPIRWEYEVILNGVTAREARDASLEYHNFYNAMRHSQPFNFTDKFGTTWTNVRIENYQRRHDAHKSWTVYVSFVLVSSKDTEILTGGGGGGDSMAMTEMIPCGDRTVPITAPAENIMSWPVTRDMLASEVQAYLTNPHTTGTFTIDVKLNGVSILSTLLTIDAGEKNSVTASTSALIATTSMVKGGEIQIDVIDEADGTASGLIVSILGASAAVDTEAPTVPANLESLSVSSSEIDWSWDASTDNNVVAGYEIQVDGGTIVNVGNVLVYHGSGYSALSTHGLRVRAYDPAGNRSEWSAEVDGVADDPPVILLVSTAKGSSDAGSTVTTDPIDTTGAKLIVIEQAFFSGVAITPTDSEGNTWTPLTTFGDTNYFSKLWYCIDPITDAAHTFSNVTPSQFPALAIAAFANAGAFDDESGDGNDGGSTIQPGSISPANNFSVLVTGVAADTANVMSIDSSFTIAEQLAHNVGNAMQVGIAYKVQGASGAENPTWNIGGVSTGLSASMAVFERDLT